MSALSAPRKPTFLINYDKGLDSGQTMVQYYSLFPGVDPKPTDADVDDDETPREALKLLWVRGRRFLPVTPNMWVGVWPAWGNEGTIMAPIGLGRAEDDAIVNQWRTKPGGSGELDGSLVGVTDIDERLAWEVGRQGQMIAHRVDREARDAGGSGFFDPFVVVPNKYTGEPVLDSYGFVSGLDMITVYRRNLRMGAGVHTKGDGSDPITWGTGKYAENTEVASAVTLIWRDDAERILRATGGVPEGPIEWTWWSNN